MNIIPRENHSISRKNISPNSLKILYRLNEAGYDAFIVGGGIRDLLLGLTPKDFDVATNATPEEVKAVFRNARIIGRRFRIVHIHFGREIIEVSTFRAAPDTSTVIDANRLARKVKHLDSAHSRGGMILRDNVYGDIEGDAARRDFTANALYYTVRGFAIHDYYRGMEDLKHRTLRMIGDPVQRYREDPVRVLRALRLAAKLDFTLEKSTAAPIRECAQMLTLIPPARLFDEFLKLFFAGNGLATYRKMLEFGVFQVLFPATAARLDDEGGRPRRLLENAFASTDARVDEGKTVTPYFLLATLLWPPVEALFQQRLCAGAAPLPAMHDAAAQVIDEQVKLLSIPRRFTIPMREIWEHQLRLPRRGGPGAERLISHPRFRAAYDFLLLRESAGEDLDGLGQWWTAFQAADRAERRHMQDALGKPRPPSKRRRRKVKSAGK